MRVLQTVCNLYFYYYYFIIRDEFEFNDMEYCVLISVLNLNIRIKENDFVRFSYLMKIFFK